MLLEDGNPPPRLLRVSVPLHTPLGPQTCQGEYELLEVQSHGSPVWKQWAGNRYLFQCDANGSWFIGSDQHLLESCEGYVFSTPTFDTSPDFSELDWFWLEASGQTSNGELTDGGLRPSGRMTVTAAGPPRILDVRVCGPNSIGGTYKILHKLQSSVEPMPTWGKVGGDVYIYFCEPEHTWYFNDRVALENRECSGLIRSTSIYGAPLPDQISSWEDFDRALGWSTHQGCISVEESPFFEIRAEAQSLVHALTQFAGLFLLLVATSRCMVRRCIQACCMPGRSSATAVGRMLVEPLLVFQQRQSEAEQASIDAEEAAVTAMIADGTAGTGTCVICFDRPAIMTFVHGRTGHKACCPQCARQIPRRKCPVCRQTFSSVILTYSV